MTREEWLAAREMMVVAVCKDTGWLMPVPVEKADLYLTAAFGECPAPEPPARSIRQVDFAVTGAYVTLSQETRGSTVYYFDRENLGKIREFFDEAEAYWEARA